MYKQLSVNFIFFSLLDLTQTDSARKNPPTGPITGSLSLDLLGNECAPDKNLHMQKLQYVWLPY